MSDRDEMQGTGATAWSRDGASPSADAVPESRPPAGFTPGTTTVAVSLVLLLGIAAGALLLVTGVVSDPVVPSGSPWWWLSTLGAAVLAVMTAPIVWSACRLRDALAAITAVGFGWAAALVTWVTLGAALEEGGGLGPVGLVGAALCSALGLMVACTGCVGRLLGVLARSGQIASILAVAPVTVTAVLALLGVPETAPIPPAWVLWAGAIVAAGLSLALGARHLRFALAATTSRDVAAYVGAGLVAIAAIVAAAAEAGHVTTLVSALGIVIAGLFVMAVIGWEYVTGRGMEAAVQGIVEWSPPEQVDEHLGAVVDVFLDDVGDTWDDPAHTSRVIQVALAIGKELDLPPQRLRVISLGALFHDIGSQAIPDKVRYKRGTLTDAERLIVQSHTEHGFDMAVRVHTLWEAAEAIRHHHEWVDGSGYPDGLVGDAIPIEARIIAVAEMFDAITRPRPYRDALPVEDAVPLMRAETGSHLDPECFAAFQRWLADTVVPFRMKR